LRGEFHPEILRGSSRAGASNKGENQQFSIFKREYLKTVADTAKVTINEVTYGLSIDSKRK